MTGRYHEEWHRRYQERLAAICGDVMPTCRQKHIAKIEADEWIEQLKKHEAAHHKSRSHVTTDRRIPKVQHQTTGKNGL